MASAPNRNKLKAVKKCLMEDKCEYKISKQAARRDDRQYTSGRFHLQAEYVNF